MCVERSQNVNAAIDQALLPAATGHNSALMMIMGSGGGGRDGLGVEPWTRSDGTVRPQLTSGKPSRGRGIMQLLLRLIDQFQASAFVCSFTNNKGQSRPGTLFLLQRVL